MKSKFLIAITIAILLPGFLISQDADQDGLNDQLEDALARRFAPEWRFQKGEQYFPISMEGLKSQALANAGALPQLHYNGMTVPITDLNLLDETLLPGIQRTTADDTWGCENQKIELWFPKKMTGEPYGFPTYVHCYPAGNGKVAISYLLFYAHDSKGTFTIFGFEPVWHRGDWEGINVLVSGVRDLNDPGSATNSQIDTVKFAGHGVDKYIAATSPHFRSIDGTHPKIYLSLGAHTAYPEPGEWHGFKISAWWNIFGIGNQYADFFHGNGLVVQSWQSVRPVINLGEADHPLVGWLNYRGLWGLKHEGHDHSPGGPVCNSRLWSHDLKGYVSWEEAILKQNYSSYWENPFELDCGPEIAETYSPEPECQVHSKCRITCNLAASLFSIIWEGDKQTQASGISPGAFLLPPLLEKKLQNTCPNNF